MAEVIAVDGLSARTAVVAERARLSNGTLFNYFPTKEALFNDLYLAIKDEIGAVVGDGLPVEGDLWDGAWHIWERWTWWGTRWPAKQQAMSLLESSSVLTSSSRRAGHVTMMPIIEIVDAIQRDGPMRDEPVELVVGILVATLEVAMDLMGRDPSQSEQRCRVGLDALCRAIGGTNSPLAS